MAQQLSFHTLATQFAAFKDQQAYTPLSTATKLNHGQAEGYCLFLRRVRVRVPLPLTSVPAARIPGVTLCLRFGVHAYDATTKTFYGKSYKGRWLPVADLHNGYVEAGPGADIVYFLSSVQDTEALVVVEASLGLVSREGDLLREVSVGWCGLTLLAKGRAAVDVAQQTASLSEPPAEVNLSPGTPRVLQLASPSQIAGALPNIPQSKLLYNIQRHRGLLRTRHLVREGHFFACSDIIPGLAVVPVKREVFSTLPFDVKAAAANNEIPSGAATDGSGAGAGGTAFDETRSLMSGTGSGTGMGSPGRAGGGALTPYYGSGGSVVAGGGQPSSSPGTNAALDANVMAATRRTALHLPVMAQTPAALMTVRTPVLAPSLTLSFQGIRLALPQGFEDKLLRVVAASREVELAMPPRSIDPASRCRIASRRLTIAIHNGLTCVAKATVHLAPVAGNVVVAAAAAGATSGGGDGMKFPTPAALGQLSPAGATLLAEPASAAGASSSCVRLPGYSPHELMAVVFSLEYLVCEPTAAAFGVLNRPTALSAGANANAALGGDADHPNDFSPNSSAAPASNASAAPGSNITAEAASNMKAAGIELENQRLILIASHAFIPAKPNPAAAASPSSPLYQLHLTNTPIAGQNSSLLDRSFVRRPLELPLFSPHGSTLRVSRATPLESGPIDVAFPSSGVNGGNAAGGYLMSGAIAAGGVFNAVVGCEIQAEQETQRYQQALAEALTPGVMLSGNPNDGPLNSVLTNTPVAAAAAAALMVMTNNNSSMSLTSARGGVGGGGTALSVTSYYGGGGGGAAGSKSVTFASSSSSGGGVGGSGGYHAVTGINSATPSPSPSPSGSQQQHKQTGFAPAGQQQQHHVNQAVAARSAFGPAFTAAASTAPAPAGAAAAGAGLPPKGRPAATHQQQPQQPQQQQGGAAAAKLASVPETFRRSSSSSSMESTGTVDSQDEDEDAAPYNETDENSGGSSGSGSGSGSSAGIAGGRVSSSKQQQQQQRAAGAGASDAKGGEKSDVQQRQQQQQPQQQQPPTYAQVVAGAASSSSSASQAAAAPRSNRPSTKAPIQALPLPEHDDEEDEDEERVMLAPSSATAHQQQQQQQQATSTSALKPSAPSSGNTTTNAALSPPPAVKRSRTALPLGSGPADDQEAGVYQDENEDNEDDERISFQRPMVASQQQQQQQQRQQRQQHRQGQATTFAVTATTVGLGLQPVDDVVAPASSAVVGLPPDSPESIRSFNEGPNASFDDNYYYDHHNNNEVSFDERLPPAYPHPHHYQQQQQQHFLQQQQYWQDPAATAMMMAGAATRRGSDAFFVPPHLQHLQQQQPYYQHHGAAAASPFVLAQPPPGRAPGSTMTGAPPAAVVDDLLAAVLSMPIKTKAQLDQETAAATATRRTRRTRQQRQDDEDVVVVASTARRNSLLLNRPDPTVTFGATASASATPAGRPLAQQYGALNSGLGGEGNSAASEGNDGPTAAALARSTRGDATTSASAAKSKFALSLNGHPLDGAMRLQLRNAGMLPDSAVANAAVGSTVGGVFVASFETQLSTAPPLLASASVAAAAKGNGWRAGIIAAPSAELELSDPFQGNQLTLLFPSIALNPAVSAAYKGSHPKSIALTLQCFAGGSTVPAPVASLVPLEGARDATAAVALTTVTCALTTNDLGSASASSAASATTNNTSLQPFAPPCVRLRWDPSRLSPQAKRALVGFLASPSSELQIDLFDGETRMPLGTARVPTAGLLRQQRRCVYLAREFDVVSSLHQQQAASSTPGEEQVAVGGFTFVGNAAVPLGAVTGRLAVIAINTGFKANGKFAEDGQGSMGALVEPPNVAAAQSLMRGSFATTRAPSSSSSSSIPKSILDLQDPVTAQMHYLQRIQQQRALASTGGAMTQGFSSSSSATGVAPSKKKTVSIARTVAPLALLSSATDSGAGRIAPTPGTAEAKPSSSNPFTVTSNECRLISLLFGLGTEAARSRIDYGAFVSFLASGELPPSLPSKLASIAYEGSSSSASPATLPAAAPNSSLEQKIADAFARQAAAAASSVAASTTVADPSLKERAKISAIAAFQHAEAYAARKGKQYAAKLREAGLVSSSAFSSGALLQLALGSTALGAEGGTALPRCLLEEDEENEMEGGSLTRGEAAVVATAIVQQQQEQGDSDGNEAAVAGATSGLPAFHITVGRLQHTLQRYFKLDLAPGSSGSAAFEALLQRVYGAALPQGGQGAAQVASHARVVDYRRFAEFCLAYLSPNGGASSTSVAAAATGSAAASTVPRVRPELLLLRGKFCRAMAAASSATSQARSEALATLGLSSMGGGSSAPAAGQESSLRASFRSADFSFTGSLPWNDFARVIRETLHLTIPLTVPSPSAVAATSADASASASSFSFESEAAGGYDGLADRQKARAVAMLHGEHNNGLRSTADDSEREAALEVAALAREGAKRDKLRRMLREAVTTTYKLYPSFGRPLYWEHTLVNGTGMEETFHISVDDPAAAAPAEQQGGGGGALRLVVDPEEFASLSLAGPASCPDVGREVSALWMGSGDVEEARARFFALAAASTAASNAANVTSADAGPALTAAVTSISITLAPGEAVVLPFTLVSFDAGEVAAKEEGSSPAAPAPVFKAKGFEAAALPLPSAALLRAGAATPSEASSGSVIVAMPSSGSSALSSTLLASSSSSTASQLSPFEAAAALQPQGAAAPSSASASASGLGLIPSHLGPELAPSPFPRKAEITIQARHSEVTAALLRVEITPTPLIGLARTMVFFFGSGQQICRGSIPLPPVSAYPEHEHEQRGSGFGGGNSSSYVKIPESDKVAASVTAPPPTSHAAAASISARWMQRLLKFRYALPSSSSSSSSSSQQPLTSVGCFHVCLYDDPHGASLSAIWRVLLIPMQPLSVHCLIGQTSTIDVLVRGGGDLGDDNAGGNAALQLVSSHPSEVTFAPPAGDKPFTLPSLLNRLRFNVTPGPSHTMTLASSSALSRKHAVFLLDSRSKALLQGWWISSSSSLPAISRSYTIPLRVGQRADKRIPYTNEFSEPKGYRVLSSDPQLVAVKQGQGQGEGEGGGEVIIPPHSRGMIRLSLGPIHALGRAEVLLFINDSSTGANEDCLLLQIEVGV